MLASVRKFALLVAIFAIISGALAALPCNSRLRITRPNLFRHCGSIDILTDGFIFTITGAGVYETIASSCLIVCLTAVAIFR